LEKIIKLPVGLHDCDFAKFEAKKQMMDMNKSPLLIEAILKNNFFI
jgi:hypothetical protein